MATTTLHGPLTVFSEDEVMFRDAVAAFANDEVRQRVQAMERASKIDPELLQMLSRMPRRQQRQVLLLMMVVENLVYEMARERRLREDTE